MMSCEQHGFMRGRSTVTNLVQKTQFISMKLDQQSQVDVIYTDFTKAFDRLDHSILLNKLDIFGLSNNFMILLKSYLLNRYQYVQHRGYRSERFLQISGVPQGSILGPLLFIMFLDDIVSDLQVQYLIYADDLKLFCEVDTPNDCDKLQNALDSIDSWCTQNNLPLNAAKCNVMTFTRKRDPIIFNYELKDTVLFRPDYIKDLGVTFDPRLNFIKHIESTASSAFKILGFIIRNAKGFNNIDTFRLLYVSYIRSKLEYASVVWAPIYITHISTLEKIQRKFLKSAAYLLDHVYPQVGYPHNLLLARFNLEELSKRRSTYQVMFLYKVLNNILDCPGILSNIGIKIPRISSRTSSVLSLPTARTNILIASPLYQMISQYCKVENSIDIFCCTVQQIKRM